MSVFHTVTQRSVQTDEICYKNVKKKIAKYIFLHLVWAGLYTEKNGVGFKLKWFLFKNC